MTSPEHLNEEQFRLFHATKAENRESIEEHGIQAHSASYGQEPGVYGFRKMTHAAAYGGHKKIVVEYRPSKVKRESSGYLVTEAIPPENIVAIHGPWT